jgi:hypothetical protein
MQDQNIKIRIDAVDNTKKAFNDLQGSLKDSSNSLFTFQNALKTYITADVIRKTFDILSSFQDMKVALNQVTGSAEQGGRAFDFLNKFSETSRFNIKDLSNAFISLYRSGINPTEELLKTFTNTAAATRQPLETLNALILLFTKGTEGGMGILQFRRLENEGVPVFKILREQFSLSKDGVEEFLKSVSGTKYVLGLLREGLGKTFGGTEAANAKNLSTTFDDVKNAGEKLIASLGDAGLNKVLAETFILLKDLIDLIKNSDLARFLGAIGTGIGFVADKIGQGVEAYKKAKKGYEEAIGMGGKKIIAPDKPIVPVANTMLQEIQSQLQIALDAFKTQWEEINLTIAKGTVKAVRDVSVAIAESIVLGKKLGDALKEIAQKILINIISKLVEEQLLRIAILAIEKIRQIYEENRTSNLARQNSLLAQQIGYQSTLAAMSSFSGSNGGGSGGGSGFMSTISTIASVASLFGFAEGGKVKAGVPITVGERGREIFMPKTDGMIVPNEKIGGGGTVLNFNINATDVKGVQELLINNRATITNLVNQALNQRGKSNLV